MRYPSLIWWWPGNQGRNWRVIVWIGQGWAFTWYWPTLRAAWHDWQKRSPMDPGVSYTWNGRIDHHEDEP